MNCDQVKEHIADYLAGALGRPEAEEFNEHLAQCAACKQETAALSETWEMLGLLEQEQPSAQLRPRFYESLEAYRQGLDSAAPAAAPGAGFSIGAGRDWALVGRAIGGRIGGGPMAGRARA